MSKRGEQLLAKLGKRAGTIADDDALDDALADAFAQAKARLSHEPVGREVLVDRIADALLASDQPPEIEGLRAIHAGDLYLACALAAKDERALALVEDELMPAVKQSAGRVDSSQPFVDEVCQRVRTRLLVGDGEAPPAIAQYRGNGPLARWVRVVATRVALDLKRADAKLDPEGEDALAALPAPGDPELEVIWRTCADEYKAALSRAFATLSKRERNLMRQRYIDELNIDALGRLYRVHPSTAFRWLKQVELRLATVTRSSLMEKLRLSESQIKSMERLVASQLHVSLTRMLRTPRPTKNE